MAGMLMLPSQLVGGNAGYHYGQVLVHGWRMIGLLMWMTPPPRLLVAVMSNYGG